MKIVNDQYDYSFKLVISFIFILAVEKCLELVINYQKYELKLSKLFYKIFQKDLL